MNSTFVLDRRVGERMRNHVLVPPESSYFDHQLQCTVLATTPSARPDLWREFVEGARESYSHFGVEKALEYERIADGSTTSLFFAKLSRSGELCGGLRVQGPYSYPQQTHADLEWASSPTGRTALRSMVADRLPHGVVEMKTVWSSVDGPRCGRPGYLGAIGASLAAAVLGCRFTLATSADHAVGPYLDSGAVMAAHIDPVPYPDHRYNTRILWWDHRAIHATASAETYRYISDAVDALLGRAPIPTEAAAS
ncbi:hypothetical protein HQ346_18870 [Rhodococcus sp. BP-252]|uniref:hypothetical protein n=1 Tax=unclassified Rhodococcus (in: high G+C Gram-positive bacteria) TaxID=192944 RepID=UPI0014303E76|nr:MULTISPECIES: hypothetical protein [unclassified Rhodococcus (in: high G+C Gram-positive bacteria)]MBY6413762.1 hypothetical protein [Rhodococcus sp. BP-320]MBY6418457.1 hypothetical protein [Rhodococcus sp. BP-321]MBY6422582.1 hypothetical protein [Rhodococcus sp. BP-324]MBY6428401.1 hypothetical protein [Rhodococcus sp. BP-323]MBY6433578.1 hypothetical protein [Rhodococcus sp. BP-322]